ncbi:hypothetical protein WOLCODRAFT_17532 [Wolfiporia cocos MD-104 SS10]|uniref:Uncharacterized protein n=1 Tax=Wolfiporia cocos (strain MD-104) TaxID=742152 RepID=A0A2H3JZI8_WOLCO|nr:hypothetical protein WOLCODRAFT_17532 [Wolfiporia cocos MD-104 SS10]
MGNGTRFVATPTDLTFQASVRRMQHVGARGSRYDQYINKSVDLQIDPNQWVVGVFIRVENDYYPRQRAEHGQISIVNLWRRRSDRSAGVESRIGLVLRGLYWRASVASAPTARLSLPTVRLFGSATMTSGLPPISYSPQCRNSYFVGRTFLAVRFHVVPLMTFATFSGLQTYISEASHLGSAATAPVQGCDAQLVTCMDTLAVTPRAMLSTPQQMFSRVRIFAKPYLCEIKVAVDAIAAEPKSSCPS